MTLEPSIITLTWEGDLTLEPSIITLTGRRVGDLTLEPSIIITLSLTREGI